MRILLVGATGFIGRHLLTVLTGAGHEVIASTRQSSSPALPNVEWCQLDLLALAADPSAFVWPDNIDLLINAAGLLSSDQQLMQRVQERAACALFDLAKANQARVLQISALGADEQSAVAFLASKARADAYLLGLDVTAVVLRPSLVLGAGGTSSGWLQRLSPWPLIPLLNNQARLQPLQIDDLCAAVLALLRSWPADSCVLSLVGPQALTQGQLLDQLRQYQGWRPGRYWVLPQTVATLAAWFGERCGWQAVNRQTLALARRDNLASPEPLANVCGYRAAALSSNLKTWPIAAHSISLALQPLLLAVLVFIWLGSALVCLGPGFDWGLRIMAEAGVSGWPAPVAVISGALVDGVLGVGLLLASWRRRALQAQLLLMLGYSLIITLWLPHYWFDPYMAIGKNLLVMLASLWLLWLQPTPGIVRE